MIFLATLTKTSVPAISRSIGAAVLVIASLSAFAQNAKPVRTATPVEISEALSQLRSADSNVQLSAMEALSASESMALRETAFSEGFASANAQMRALALMGRLASSNVLTFEVENSSRLPEEEWRKVLETRLRGQSKVTCLKLKVDRSTGQISFHYGGGRLAGQALTLTFNGGTVITARLADGAKLRGTMSVKSKGSFSVVAELQ